MVTDIYKRGEIRNATIFEASSISRICVNIEHPLRNGSLLSLPDFPHHPRRCFRRLCFRCRFRYVQPIVLLVNRDEGIHADITLGIIATTIGHATFAKYMYGAGGANPSLTGIGNPVWCQVLINKDKVHWYRDTMEDKLLELSSLGTLPTKSAGSTVWHQRQH